MFFWWAFYTSKIVSKSSNKKKNPAKYGKIQKEKKIGLCHSTILKHDESMGLKIWGKERKNIYLVIKYDKM